MSDAFTPLLQCYGRLMVECVRTLTEDPDEPRERLLPIISALLSGREALRHGATDAAIQQFAEVGAHLALLVFGQGPREASVLDFVAAQRRRLTEAAEAGRDDWLRRPARHHFDRALANHTSVAYLVDPDRHPAPDVEQVRAQAADVGNYLVFFLHTAGVDLPHPQPVGEGACA